MKRIKSTEEQYNGFLKQYEDNGNEDSENTAQDISNMRHNVADLKKNELKVIVKDAITKAFKLGCDFESSSPLDMERRKDLLLKLNGVIDRIDDENKRKKEN